jgi:hypothetical protein
MVSLPWSTELWRVEAQWFTSQHKSMQVIQKSRSCSLFFLYSRSGPSWIHSTGSNSWCRILCGSFETSVWTCATCMTWIVGRKEMDPASRQCTLTLGAYCALFFHQKRHDYHGSPLLFARFSPLRLFFLFPKVKTIMQSEHFGDVENIKCEMTRLLKNLTSQDMQHCFVQLKKHWAKCIHSGGKYFEGDHMPIPEWLKLDFGELSAQTFCPHHV